MLKNIFNRIFIVLFIFLFTGNLFSQTSENNLQTKISISSEKFIIGDQVELKITVENPGKAFVFFPSLQENEEISKDIEAIASRIDTILNDKKEVISLEQFLTITSFSEGQHEIKDLTVLYQYPNDTTIYSSELQPLFINVSGITVDTTKTIKDIKGILKEPLTFGEILPYILIGLGLVLISFLVYYIIKRYRENKPLIPIPVKPPLPAHEVALRNLEALRLKKLWQNNRVKDYYTELTDILRWYIVERFKVRAAEMTSDEIMDALREVKDVNIELNSLYKIFQTADLVKFAKSNPLPDEHDACFHTAVRFVEQTAPRIEEDTKPAELEENIEK